jgi:hypothetical protein
MLFYVESNKKTLRSLRLCEKKAVDNSCMSAIESAARAVDIISGYLPGT